MSYLLDVYYELPDDADREARISEIAVRRGGKLRWKGIPPAFTGPDNSTDVGDYSTDIGCKYVLLGFEFRDFDAATLAQEDLLQNGEWAAPPADIGN